jgi:D-aminopeptidase
MTPEAAQAVVKRAVKAGLMRRASFKPWVPREPVTVDLTFKNYRPSQVLALLPMFTRTSSHSVRFTAKNMVEASEVMEFIGGYQPDLTP